jgi:hypothetical protein
MYQQLWGYNVEEKLYLGVREQKRLNTTGLEDAEDSHGFKGVTDFPNGREGSVSPEHHPGMTPGKKLTQLTCSSATDDVF